MVGSQAYTGTELPTFAVSDFVALVNQTLDHVFQTVNIVGELSNFKISKNKWVYFDVKDDTASVRFFGTVYMLTGPFEDGMMIEVRGTPRLHPTFGFSVNVQSMRPVGEGSIRKASELLEAKLKAEGLFAAERKRPLPYPPKRVGLITSGESAAYADFIKILGARWQGLAIELADVQVQGERSPAQIVSALQWFNEQADPPDVIVVVRGGGSADDLQAFSVESVVRAIAASRIPTMVAIGHEVDTSLAELAADMRGSTPSNAAELLVPDRREVVERLSDLRGRLTDDMEIMFDDTKQGLLDRRDEVELLMERMLVTHDRQLVQRKQLAALLDPTLALTRGFAIVRNKDGRAIRCASDFVQGDIVDITVSDAVAVATISTVTKIAAN